MVRGARENERIYVAGVPLRMEMCQVYVWLSYIRVIVIYRFGSKITILFLLNIIS